MSRGIRLFIGLLGSIASGAAPAHVGVHSTDAFATGLAHPFMGLDHLLAMVAVGVWAAQLGGRYRLILPAVFVAAMAAGAAASLYGIALPQVEGMVALSVLILGMLVALAVRTQWHWPVSLIALFAMFHGYEHGTAMPDVYTPWIYFTGFLAATAFLHAIGVVTASILRTRPILLRTGGMAVSLAGSLLLVAALG